MASASTKGAQVVRFGIFEADLNTGELRKSGVRIKIHGQPFEVLAMLLARPGELITREEIQQRLWPNDTFVDFEHGVNTAINRLRDALGDSAESPRFIETVPRRGYRFIAPVDAQLPSSPIAAATAHSGPPVTTPAAVPHSARLLVKRATVLTSIAVVAAALLALLSLKPVRQRIFARGNSPRIQSLAVLPLTNLSSDADQDFFADGMTEALTTDLGKISALRVISRTSVMQYKGTRKPLPEIAQELHVDALIEGTVSRSGNHLRITANLVQASPEKHLWAETYESEMGDVLTVQGQVAQAVAREIQVKLTPEEQKLLGSTREVNPKAHDDYLKGRYLLNKDTWENFDKAIQYFQGAIEEAPSDPLAYAGLANCYVFLGWSGDLFAGHLSAKDIMPKASDAAQRALQLDENLAEAHAALGDAMLTFDWNWSGAEREFKRAIELNPSYSLAHVLYGHYLVAIGRFDESVAEAKRSLELDPFSPTTMDFAGWAFYLAHRYDLVLQQSRKSLELAPESPWVHFHLAEVYEQTGRSSEAVQEFMKAEELFGMSQDRLAALREAYRQSGEKGYWRKILALCRAESNHPRKFASTSGYGWCDYMEYADVAALQLRLGEVDAAFESLERGYTNHEPDLIYLKVDPRWDKIRSDPRFRDLVLRVGLPQ